MIKKIIFFFSFFIMLSCDNEVPIDENFVIEAFLFQGEVVDDIKIIETKLWNSSDSTTSYIENANVKIYGNGYDYQLNYNPQIQRYITSDNIDVISGNTYGIEVTVKDRTATAETTVPTKPTGLKLSEDKVIIPPLFLSPALPNLLANLYESARTTISWDNPNDEYHYLTIKYVDDDQDLIFSEEFPDALGEFFNNFSLQSQPTKELSYSTLCLSLKNYGRYKVTLYKINKDYYSLFENQQQDGYELNEPPSNVINAFGVFSAFASDSIFFEISRE
jgi:hypothetical protein